jgi:phenylalanyl-tRNA synthetase alpha chain
VCPGITYRRDAIDRLHTGTPHQLDLWRISRTRCDDRNMDQMVRILLEALVPGRAWRSEPRTHPYTLNGRQVDVLDGDDWVEVWECGLTHPDVLAGAGLDGWYGLALGMGLDRLLMMRKGIPDIRLLRATHPGIAGQMADLEPYRPVSNLPVITRDLSMAIPADDQPEDLGDRVRDSLGADADLLYAVTILSKTSYDDVPPAAQARLGLDPSQKNVLVRISIRPIQHPLTAAEANTVRDNVYAAIHQGATGQWAAPPATATPGKPPGPRTSANALGGGP